jgi:plasmid stabilization system protein ParE
MRIRWTPAAAADLQGIRDLKQWPGRGRPAEAGTREILFPPTPYIAVYRVKEKTIEVVRIYHTAQNR